MISQVNFSLRGIRVTGKSLIERIMNNLNKYEQESVNDKEDLNNRRSRNEVFYVYAYDGRDKITNKDDIKQIVTTTDFSRRSGYEDYYRKRKILPPQIAIASHVRHYDKDFWVLTVNGLDMRPKGMEARWARKNKENFDIFYNNLMELIGGSLEYIKNTYKNVNHVVVSKIGVGELLHGVPIELKTEYEQKIIRKMKRLFTRLKENGFKLSGMGFSERESKQWFGSNNAYRTFNWWVDHTEKAELKNIIFINSGNPHSLLGTGGGLNEAIGSYTDLRIVAPPIGQIGGYEKINAPPKPKTHKHLSQVAKHPKKHSTVVQ